MPLPRYIPQYTYEDYVQWQGDWELWSGVPVAMSPSSKRKHQRLCANLVYLLKRAMEETGCESCEVLPEIDWKVAEDTVVRPDLVVVRGHPDSDFVEETPPFVCEILSKSTQQRDQVYKRELYERLGVKYYLMIDPRDDSFHLLQNGTSGFTDCETGEIVLHPDCRLALPLRSLF